MHKAHTSLRPYLVSSRRRSPKGPRPIPIYRRFWKKVKKARGGCWLWVGGRTLRGYGIFGVATQFVMLAHRAAWELSRSFLRPGEQVHHSCDEPRCVNPDHLWTGSQKDNLADMKSKGRGLAGEKHPNSKLTDAKIRQIRLLLSTGWKQWAVANRFRVSRVTVSRIGSRHLWGHVQ